MTIDKSCVCPGPYLEIALANWLSIHYNKHMRNKKNKKFHKDQVSVKIFEANQVQPKIKIIYQ